MDISNDHFRTVSNEIAEQNEQTITTNIEQGNSYYFNTEEYNQTKSESQYAMIAVVLSALIFVVTVIVCII